MEVGYLVNIDVHSSHRSFSFLNYLYLAGLYILNLVAGADIREMLNKSYAENIKEGLLQEWDNVSKCKKPIIAAVNGYAVSLTPICAHIF